MTFHVTLQSKQGVGLLKGNGLPQHKILQFGNAVRVALYSPLRSLVLGLAFAAAPIGQVLAESAPSQSQGDALAIARAHLDAIFQQALADDAAGRHEQARKWFDALQGTELQVESAVPSAVNLAAIGRFADAKRAFGELAKSTDVRVSSYAKFWQLWLIARTHSGKSSVLQKRLVAPAKDIQAKDGSAKALAALYAGKGSVNEVFAAIDAKHFSSEVLRQDARAEAAFFVGGYLQYVRQDKTAALNLYRRELPFASASIERPLIKQAMAAL